MLAINGLTCGYASQGKAGFQIRNINLKVASGEIIGIIGPNGSGKTTLLKAITRVLKPMSGAILLEGEDIRRMKTGALARKVAVVSQSVETGFMTVEEFVLLGRTPYYERFRFLETANDLKIARDAMALTNSLKLKDSLMSRISGGERQLALIARALAQEPKLLLLDEPTTYLDIAHQVHILDLIRRLNKNFGLTVIMVLHDLNLAGEYCQRLALFNNGIIHKFGLPEEVLDYAIIEEVYKTVVVVETNPISRKPYVLVISEAARELSAETKTTDIINIREIRGSACADPPGRKNILNEITQMTAAKPNRTPAQGASFVSSWSGGKDSCLALHRARAAGATPAYILTIISEDGIRSRSHGLRKEVLEAQASAMGIPLLIRCATWAEYESVFVDALREIRKEGIAAGVFGDIDFPPHLEWEEKVCALAGMTAYLPLWECARETLLHEFLSLGYKALIVMVNEKQLDRKFLGRMIDREIISEFRELGIDPCGENGEYHTLVVDGPAFSRPLPVEKGAISEHSGYCSLDVRVRSPAGKP